MLGGVNMLESPIYIKKTLKNILFSLSWVGVIFQLGGGDIYPSRRGGVKILLYDWCLNGIGALNDDFRHGWSIVFNE